MIPLLFLLHNLIFTSLSYAPAYERFGSQIRAIHFIGPDKPWLHLPFRAPGSSSQNDAHSKSVEGRNPESSYDYSSLLDQWFAVYDRHYRSAVPIFSTTGELLPTFAFRETIYENAWDKEVALISGTTSGPFALDKLKQLAVEGLGQMPTREKGEGAYMTLPLDGRIDLMSRPRSQMCPPYAHGFSITASQPRSGTDSTQSHRIQTPEDVSSVSLSSTSTSAGTNNSCPWDPWGGAYSNLWDLVPGIKHQFSRAGPKQNLVRPGKIVNSQGKQESIYRSWEDRTESTSRDGDDEEEDEESK